MFVFVQALAKSRLDIVRFAKTLLDHVSSALQTKYVEERFHSFHKEFPREDHTVVLGTVHLKNWWIDMLSHSSHIEKPEKKEVWIVDKEQ